jgi:glutamate 5-kinase
MNEYKRIVIKVGTSTLTHSTGRINLARIERLSMILSDLANSGKEVVLVTSGAIGTGMARLGVDKRPSDIAGKQAMAAIGQGLLMHIYEKMFSEYGRAVAQILITNEDILIPERRENAARTIDRLLNYGVIPIVNENDTIATDEIKIGDNDVLSAYVAKLSEANMLILLSDIDGLYDRDPSLPGARLINRVNKIDDGIRQIAKGAGSKLGTGGMKTKINAAKIALDSGFTMVIANGARPDNIYNILAGEEIGTIFSK